LDTIPEIWKTRKAPYENYHPDRLAYYFFQALSIVNHLHEKQVYHGAIRPLAFEIFRNQRVKVSDFNYALKLDPNDGN